MNDPIRLNDNEAHNLTSVIVDYWQKLEMEQELANIDKRTAGLMELVEGNPDFPASDEYAVDVLLGDRLYVLCRRRTLEGIRYSVNPSEFQLVLTP